MCEGGVSVAGVVGVKLLFSWLLGGQDDVRNTQSSSLTPLLTPSHPHTLTQAHIGAILLSKLTSYQDFHTQLYTCSPEFDFLPPTYWLKLSLTLLFPAALLGAALAARRVLGVGGAWLGKGAGQDTLAEVRGNYRMILNPGTKNKPAKRNVCMCMLCVQ